MCLKETNSFELYITERRDLAGLPESLIQMAAMEADLRKKTGVGFSTLHFPSYVPFMQYSENRISSWEDVKAYSSRAFRDNEFDNSQNVLKIVKPSVLK